MAELPQANKVIASRKNPLFSTWLDCLESKGIKKHGFFLVFGARAVHDTLKDFPELCRSLVFCKKSTVPSADLIGFAKKATAKSQNSFSLVELADVLFDELDVFGTKAPLLVLHLPQLNKFDFAQPAHGLEILCALGNPSNVGALIRSAAAFGAGRVVLLKECASPFHPKAVRAASGATLRIELCLGPSINDVAEQLSKHSSRCLALAMNGRDLSQYQWQPNARLLLGEEGQGTPVSESFDLLNIPMQAGVESLNATIAASIAMYDYTAKIKKAPR